MSRPAWFVAVLLLMLALVISAQLIALGFGVQLCLRQAEIVFQYERQHVQAKGTFPPPPAPNTGCARIQQDFKEAVERNGSLVLALLGGGGLAAVAGAAQRDR